MRVYSALIRVSGLSSRVLIQAVDITRARALLEAQYGAGSVKELHSATSYDLRRSD